jgi:hypothetical protein
VLRAQGQREAQILRAEGEAKAIDTVFRAIHEGDPDQKLLSYQYLQMLPQIARGDANKLWIIPSEVGDALKGLGSVLGTVTSGSDDGPTWASDDVPDVELDAPTLQDPNEALAQARREAAGASAEAEGAATHGVSPGPMPSRSAGRPGLLGDVEPERVDPDADGPVTPPPPPVPPTS